MSRILRVVLALALSAPGSAAMAHARPGDIAKPFTVTTFDNQKVTSDTLKGHVVILNFWATWCVPCKKELPELDIYYRHHAAQGLTIFAVTTEESVPDYELRPLAAMLAFQLAHRISGSAYEEMEGVPTNYVIDRNGVVRYAKADAFDQETLDAVIGPLLAQPATPTASTIAAAAN